MTPGLNHDQYYHLRATGLYDLIASAQAAMMTEFANSNDKNVLGTYLEQTKDLRSEQINLILGPTIAAGMVVRIPSEMIAQTHKILSSIHRGEPMSLSEDKVPTNVVPYVAKQQSMIAESFNTLYAANDEGKARLRAANYPHHFSMASVGPAIPAATLEYGNFKAA